MSFSRWRSSASASLEDEAVSGVVRRYLRRRFGWKSESSGGGSLRSGWRAVKKAPVEIRHLGRMTAAGKTYLAWTFGGASREEVDKGGVVSVMIWLGNWLSLWLLVFW